MAYIDETGNRYGKLMALEAAGCDSSEIMLWKCLCDCGNSTVVRGSDLRRGKTMSCGCRRHERPIIHGHGVRRCRTITYHSWISMHQRCSNSARKDYKNYGGRGITVCKRWVSFENFLEDMGERPDDRTLDRINNDGNYEPGNCRWATRSEQRKNQRKKKKPS